MNLTDELRKYRTLIEDSEPKNISEPEDSIFLSKRGLIAKIIQNKR